MHIYRNHFSYDNILKEYVRYLPFGLVIASTFLQVLHDPDMPYVLDLPLDAIVKEIFDRGGDRLNAELCGLVVDIYRLHEKFNLTLDKI